MVAVLLFSWLLYLSLPFSLAVGLPSSHSLSFSFPFSFDFSFFLLFSFLSTFFFSLAIFLAKWTNDVHLVGSVLKFYVVFLNMLIFQTIWQNKNEHKTQKSRWRRRRRCRFSRFQKIYRRTIMLNSFRSDSNGLHCMAKKWNFVLNFQTRCLVYITEQLSLSGLFVLVVLRDR